MAIGDKDPAVKLKPLTAIVRLPEIAVSLLESVTFTVKLAVPTDEATGVPEITPALDNDRPSGRVPEFRVQFIYGVTPPDAANVVIVYAIPASTSVGTVVVVTCRVASIAIESALVAVAPVESFTCTEKLKVAIAVGVPLITPPADKGARPVGRFPVVMLQVYGAIPPDAIKVVVG